MEVLPAGLPKFYNNPGLDSPSAGAEYSTSID